MRGKILCESYFPHIILKIDWTRFRRHWINQVIRTIKVYKVLIDIIEHGVGLDESPSGLLPPESIFLRCRVSYLFSAKSFL